MFPTYYPGRSAERRAPLGRHPAGAAPSVQAESWSGPGYDIRFRHDLDRDTSVENGALSSDVAVGF